MSMGSVLSFQARGSVLSGQSDQSVLSWQTGRALNGSRTEGDLSPHTAPLIVAASGVVLVGAWVVRRRTRR